MTAYLKEYKVASYGEGVPDKLRTDFDDDPDLCASDCRYVAAFKYTVYFGGWAEAAARMGVGKSNAKVYVQKETGITF